jgi:hypothetical protein
MALREDVLAILAAEMGPAAATFLDRQCKTHLKKESPLLVKADLPVLAKWVGVGAALVLSEPVAKVMMSRIQRLGS